MGVFVRMCELPSEFRRREKVQMSCLSVSPPTAFLCYTFYPCFSRTNNDHMSVRLMNHGRYNSSMASVLFFFFFLEVPLRWVPTVHLFADFYKGSGVRQYLM